MRIVNWRTIQSCQRLPPDFANISPLKYSLRNSALRSISRYCSGVRNDFDIDPHYRTTGAGLPTRPASDQKYSFAPSWTIRGSRKVVIFPNSALVLFRLPIPNGIG